MTVRGKLLTVGVVVGCIATAALVINWHFLSEKEGYVWDSTGAPGSAKEYVEFVEGLHSGFHCNQVQWLLMRLSPTMRARLEQRKREAEAYAATQPKAPPPEATSLPSDPERRRKRREDFVKSASAIKLSPAMTAAMLALIDEADAGFGTIPIHVTVNNTVDPGEDRFNPTVDVARYPFKPEQGCEWDMRLDKERLRISPIADVSHGVFVTITLKDVAEHLLVTTTVEAELYKKSYRRLGATVEVNVVPPGGGNLSMPRAKWA